MPPIVRQFHEYAALPNYCATFVVARHLYVRLWRTRLVERIDCRVSSQASRSSHPEQQERKHFFVPCLPARDFPPIILKVQPSQLKPAASNLVHGSVQRSACAVVRIHQKCVSHVRMSRDRNPRGFELRCQSARRKLWHSSRLGRTHNRANMCSTWEDKSVCQSRNCRGERARICTAPGCGQRA